MNDPLKKLSSLKNTTLSEKERVEMRGDIVAFMKANPVEEVVNINSSDIVRNTNAVRHHTYAGPFTAFNTVKRKRMISAILLAMFALSGGVSYAAEGSLPGDTLYPVKIHINEGVEGTLAVGAKADAEFAHKQLERRAQEAEALAKAHRLDAEAKAELRGETESHLKASLEAEEAMRNDKEGEEGARAAHKEVNDIIAAHEETFLGFGVSTEADGNIHTENLPVAGKMNVQNESDLKVRSSLLQSIFGGSKETNVKVESEASSSDDKNASESVINTRADIRSDGDTGDNDASGEIHVEAQGGGEIKLPNVPSEIHTETKGQGVLQIGL